MNKLYTSIWLTYIVGYYLMFEKGIGKGILLIGISIILFFIYIWNKNKQIKPFIKELIKIVAILSITTVLIIYGSNYLSEYYHQGIRGGNHEPFIISNLIIEIILENGYLLISIPYFIILGFLYKK